MKTAISVPDQLFEAVERIVRRSGRHRSEIYAEALREYVARHSENEVTKALDAALVEIDQETDLPFLRAAAYDTLKKAEW
jgi:metal-responsive CopG/Arc/MetJ family transcriptional regulator